MKIANVKGNPHFVVGDRTVDIPRTSNRRFSTAGAIFAHWAEFETWTASIDLTAFDSEPLPDRHTLGPPVPNPGQIWAAGLNYPSRPGADTSSRVPPEVFMKSVSSLVGPYSEIQLSGDMVDFEVELVAVIGVSGSRIPVSAALDHVAGYLVGQDVSDRRLQFAVPPQLCMAKSMYSFAVTGPWFTSKDEIPDLDSAAISCSVNGVVQQNDVLGSMVNGVPELVNFFSSIAPLRAGDLIYCGTPAGVGFQQEPARFLRAGDIVTSEIQGIGTIENVCVRAEERDSLRLR